MVCCRQHLQRHLINMWWSINPEKGMILKRTFERIQTDPHYPRWQIHYQKLNSRHWHLFLMEATGGEELDFGNWLFKSQPGQLTLCPKADKYSFPSNIPLDVVAHRQRSSNALVASAVKFLFSQYCRTTVRSGIMMLMTSGVRRNSAEESWRYHRPLRHEFS